MQHYLPIIQQTSPARVMLHGSLFLAFATVGSALLVWPQWTAADGVHNALQIQQEREQA